MPRTKSAGLDFEQLREKNIRDRNKKLQELGLLTISDELSEILPSKPAPVVKRVKKVEEQNKIPTRRSGRLAEAKEKGTDLKTHHFSYLEIEKAEARLRGGHVSDDDETAEREERLHRGEAVDLGEVIVSTSMREDAEKLKQMFGESSGATSAKRRRVGQGKENSKTDYVFADQTEDIEVPTDAEEALALRQIMGYRFGTPQANVMGWKITSERSMVARILPSTDKLTILSGDHKGVLGIAVLDHDVHVACAAGFEQDAEPTVVMYRPHYRAISGIVQCDTDKLYTCGYDGDIRCLSIESGLISHVVDTDQTGGKLYKHMVGYDDNTLLVSTHDGYLVVVDRRDPKNSTQTLKIMTGDRMRTLDLHPTQRHFMAAASHSQEAVIWDLRTMGSKMKRAATLPHTSAVSSAFFSTTGTRLITSENNNHQSVFDTTCLPASESLKPLKRMYHNNHVGRYLTRFQPRFHPHSDNYFVVGCLESLPFKTPTPRFTEIYDSAGKIVRRLQGMTAISCLNVFHPSLPYMAGFTSSGRFHLWSAVDV